MNDSGLTTDAYFETRFTPDPRREAAWRRIVPYLERWVPSNAAVLDVGAGYCSFINAVLGSRRVAVDLHADSQRFAGDGVEFVVGSATDLSMFKEGEFDVVFASNLLEHLDRFEIAQALNEFRRVLRPGGRLILVQPNYRLCAGRYFDDFTHVTPLSDVSLADFVAVGGFEIERVESRFLPFSLKSQMGRFSPMIPMYLRLPWRPFAGQMLLVAVKGR